MEERNEEKRERRSIKRKQHSMFIEEWAEDEMKCRDECTERRRCHKRSTLVLDLAETQNDNSVQSS